MRCTPPIGDTWQETATVGAGGGGALAAFFLAAVTTSVDLVVVRGLVLVAVLVLTVAAGRLAGGAQSASVAVMGAFSFDFFHIEPIRVLHLRTLALLLMSLLGVVALTATPQEGRSSESSGRSNR